MALFDRNRWHHHSEIAIVAEEILDRYKNHPEVKEVNYLLPVLSNQKSNALLKGIVTLCGIIKPLTTRLARHTFATIITLTNGVPIESVRKMLGHKDLRTTQHDAKIVYRKISDDMKALKIKLEEKKRRNLILRKIKNNKQNFNSPISREINLFLIYIDGLARI